MKMLVFFLFLMVVVGFCVVVLLIDEFVLELCLDLGKVLKFV